MSKKPLINQYQIEIKQLIDNAKSNGLKSQQVTDLLKSTFIELKNNQECSRNNYNSNKTTTTIIITAQFIKRNFLKLFTTFIFLFSLLLYILLNTHIATSSIVLRNVQGLAYPTLKLVRHVSVPILKLLPSLTDLYDESCLIENPYFYVIDDMECWPCENVYSVIDLTGLSSHRDDNDNDFSKLGEGVPFIIKTDQVPITFNKLQELYKNYTNEINYDSRRFNGNNINNLHELFQYNETTLSSDIHVQWRINKMSTSRIIRKLFPKPYFLSDRSGQAVERFLLIDGPKSQSYKLPNTECSYIFIIQGIGERTINLIPSNECKGKCRSVSVVLKPSYILMYNWWYWRPISLPLNNATSLSISYINSYC